MRIDEPQIKIIDKLIKLKTFDNHEISSLKLSIVLKTRDFQKKSLTYPLLA